MPHVSVVTASYNSIATIEKTIDSVQSATGPWDIQQVFSDGGSTDGTVELIKSKMRPNDLLISEKDEGIADAFNKGISIAEGTYIHILNSDDWADPDFWNILLNGSNNLETPLLHSDLMLVSGGKPYKRVSGSPNYMEHINYSMKGLMHPSSLAHRSLFDSVGPFSKSHKYAMDLEWFQRAYDAGFTSKYIPGGIVFFAAGEGQSFSDGGVVRESTELARKRGVSNWTIFKMQMGKRARLMLHRYYTRLKLIGK